MDKWYVCRTKPNCERQAKRHLLRQGFDAYLPMLSVRRLIREEMQTRNLPLFPGYLFIRLDLDGEHWKHIGGTRGVIALLPSSERPHSIKVEDVDGLKEAEAAGLFRAGAVEVGENVMIFRGTLAGQVLKCISVAGERISCLWTCLGAERVVSVQTRNVSVLR
jgi:transcriptional antiterminator RfaH